MFRYALSVETGLVAGFMKSGLDFYHTAKVMSIVDSAVTKVVNGERSAYNLTVVSITATFLERCKVFTLDIVKRLEEALEAAVKLSTDMIDVNVVCGRIFAALGTFEY